MNQLKTPDKVSDKMPTQSIPTRHPTQRIAGKARLRRRHYLLVFSFFIWVFVPLIATGFYLTTVAKDQYASYVGFAVRTEEASSGVDFLGSITQLSTSGSSDTDILYKYIQGRQMILAVDAQLDLRQIYERPSDPVFSLSKGATIEDLETYWKRVVDVFYEPSSGLIDVRVVAFEPQDSLDLAEVIVAESTILINRLAATAREDTTGYAQEELDRAIGRLKQARQAMTEFRVRTRIVDPLADTQGRMGLLNNLQAQLVAALIELDILQQTVLQENPRTRQIERRVEVIRKRILDERENFGGERSDGEESYSMLVGAYESLSVDLEFAEISYFSALASYDSALAEARRQSRYLAKYTEPTLAEASQYPKRFVLFFLLAGGLLLSWSIAMLIYYSVRDRR